MEYLNGRYPDSALATTQLYYPGTTNGRRCLREVQPYADAMALAFALEFGKPLYATDGYRDYATQVLLKQQKGAFAATPGTSVHGLGEAFDLASSVNSAGSKEHAWVVANEGRFGFKWPTWASNSNPNDGQFEPWHHEYVGGGASAPRVLYARSGMGEVGIGHTTRAKVVEIQTRLNYHLPTEHHVVVDGDYGFMTAVAVVRFQMAKRAYVSGRVSLLLLSRLRSNLETTRYERALRRLREMRARARARLEREQNG